jgi:hypothetical protein
MRNRLLGILLVVLTVVGGLNLVQAVRAHFSSDGDASAPSADHSARTASRSSESVRDGVFLDQTFKVADGQLLEIAVQHADVTVETGETDEARVTVSVSASSDDRAREIFERMNFETFQDGDRVVLRSTPRSEWNWNGRFRIEVRASMPRRFDLDLTSTHGDVTLASIDGTVALNTTHGDVDAERIAGPAVRLNSTHGEIHANALLADLVEVRTTHGDIAVGIVQTARLDAITTHSDIEIDELEGSGEVQTTHGDVTAGVLKHEGLRVRTTHGDVLLVLPSGSGADVSLRGEHVSLPSGVDFDGVRDEERAEGTLNGGGPALEVSTTFGEVTLRTD